MITVTVEVHVLHPQTSWVSTSSSHTYETDKTRRDQSGNDGDVSSLPTLGLTALHGRTCEKSLTTTPRTRLKLDHLLYLAKARDTLIDLEMTAQINYDYPLPSR